MVLLMNIIVVSTTTTKDEAIEFSTTPHLDWSGTWRGSLINYPRNSEFSPVDVLLEIGPFPTANNSCTMWRTTYSENGTVRAIKDYRLCREYSDNDLFIDEGYGLKLATRWIGDVLITPFKYDNLLLISSMRMYGNILQEEIVTIDDKPTIEGPQSLYPRAIQRIETKRVDAKNSSGDHKINFTNFIYFHLTLIIFQNFNLI